MNVTEAIESMRDQLEQQFAANKSLIDQCDALRAELDALKRQEPVAWRDPTNLNPGQSVTFQLDVHLKWSHIFRQPLYAAPIPAQQEPKK